MQLQQTNFKAFLKSPTARLAGTYLAIIMILSIGFSTVFYRTSSHELGRQIPPDSYFRTNNIGRGFPSVDDFFQQRIDEGRKVLLTRLVFLNIGALALGGVVSYALARRNLEPIEEAMEAQSQFVSDASHELRTPLTAIQTTNEVFLRKAKPTLDEAKQVITRNTEDVVRLKALSDGLLNLAQHQNVDVVTAPVDLQSVIGEAMNQVVGQATERDVAVHDEVPQLKVLADPGGLTQSAVILLDNAVKYSNEHGNVYVRGFSKGKFGFLEIRDEGIGIRASDLPHIFRRFYRADSSRSHGERNGYGLGLAIADQIISQQNGEISATSTPGKGSTFVIKLPLA